MFLKILGCNIGVEGMDCLCSVCTDRCIELWRPEHAKGPADPLEPASMFTIQPGNAYARWLLLVQLLMLHGLNMWLGGNPSLPCTPALGPSFRIAQALKHTPFLPAGAFRCQAGGGECLLLQ